MLKIGVIGCGTVSSYGHLPTITASTDWELAAVVDQSEARLDAVRSKYGDIPTFTHYKDMLESTQLDAVTVATHIDTHCQMTCDALNQNLHVLCEKPMAKNLDECQKMVDTAQEKNRLLAINFNTRSGSIYREIKRIIDTGDLGTLRVIRIVFDWSCHQWQPPERLDAFMSEGGPIIDSAVHFFEGARWFSGQEFVHIDAHGVALDPYEAPQHAISTCTMTGNVIALIEAGWLYCKRTKDQAALFRIDVIGDNGTVSYDSPPGVLRLYTQDTTDERPFTDLSKHFETVYDLFAQSLHQGKLVELASGYDGLKATEAAFQALASTKRKFV